MIQRHVRYLGLEVDTLCHVNDILWNQKDAAWYLVTRTPNDYMGTPNH